MKKLIKKLKIKLGWINCTYCNSFIRPKWIQDWIYSSEEPPMFYHYECPKCGARTDKVPSILTQEACKTLGYTGWYDYYDKVLKSKYK